MQFLILGSAGMAGHTVALYLHEQGHDITGLDRINNQLLSPFYLQITADVTDDLILKKLIQENKYDAIINCIGVLNKDAEKNKHLAVYLNSYLPHYLSYLTKDSNTKVIQMSTDCVFSGKSGNYSENSLTDGETFYDRSKALGELVNHKDLSFRNSIVGPDINKNGIGLFNWFMKMEGEIFGYSKAIWTGVTTLTLATAMERAVHDNLTGLYHLVNNDPISKYDLLLLFNKYFRKGKVIIHESNKVNLNKSLVNNRKDFKFTVPSYEEMIIEMEGWITRHKTLYPHYFE